jgi:hypothetical protein
VSVLDGVELVAALRSAVQAFQHAGRDRDVQIGNLLPLARRAADAIERTDHDQFLSLLDAGLTARRVESIARRVAKLEDAQAALAELADPAGPFVEMRTPPGPTGAHVAAADAFAATLATSRRFLGEIVLEGKSYETMTAAVRAAFLAGCSHRAPEPTAEDLRRCGWCHRWASRPCGNECCWDPGGESVAQVRAVALALETPWPLHEVLARLAAFADHALIAHGCDVLGHEVIRGARDGALAILRNMGIEIESRGARACKSRPTLLDEIADRLVGELMTIGNFPEGMRGDRLAVMLNGRDIGGWGAGPLRDRVLAGLRAAATGDDGRGSIVDQGGAS